MSEKTKTALISMAVLLAYMIFGSSVSIFNPTNENLGILFGSLFGLTIVLGPIAYVRLKKIKVKNPKPLYVEPPQWKFVPLYLIACGIVFFAEYIVLMSLPGFNYEYELEKGTFIGTSVMMLMLLTCMYGPVTVYAVYIHTHYKRIVEYKTAEWRRIREEKRHQAALGSRGPTVATGGGSKRKGITAALLNIVPGLGYLYLRKRATFGSLMLAGFLAAVASSMFDPTLGDYQQATLGVWSGLATLGVLLIVVAFMYDAYDLARSEA